MGLRVKLKKNFKKIISGVKHITRYVGYIIPNTTCRYEELDDFIDIAMFDQDEVGKDDRMGRVEVDLRDLSREVSHNLWRPIKEGEGQLNVIITISATAKVIKLTMAICYYIDRGLLLQLNRLGNLKNKCYAMTF